nr:immunoglobulin heavy chain junction region [Macaca mulatta]MOV48920.1 immunoglobulin heavy chain junction region [Macaca mulatta]MOV49484.1 immunoglobulin heavy chain junction region [Macaca mulatta]MOV49711.1 immunoglobulin heavy chain junction region [Macaca mulatta]MOV49759.1 immunoglobulin heavy chain junction region [Macaca mulatta]
CAKGSGWDSLYVW